MLSYNDIYKQNINRIHEILSYDHTKRFDLNILANENLDKYSYKDILNIWESYITNPANEKHFKYKVYIPLDVVPKHIDYSKDNQSSNLLPSYYDIYNNYDKSDEVLDNDDSDIYDNLILNEHREDILKYRLTNKVKQIIQQSILKIMKIILEEYLEDYDTLWLDVDGYDFKYSVKIKYDYKKNKLIGEFTGIVITILLIDIDNVVDLDSSDEEIKKKCL